MENDANEGAMRTSTASYPPDARYSQPFVVPPGGQAYPQPGYGYPNPAYGYSNPAFTGYPPQQSQQQQQQQSVVVVNANQPAVYRPPPVSLVGAIVLSCLVFWFCGWLIGGIAFILALVGQSSAGAGDVRGAIQLRNASYGLSIAGIVCGVIIIAVVAGILGSAANRVVNYNSNYDNCYYNLYGQYIC